MRRLILAAVLLPIAAHAQPAPAQFCMPGATARGLMAYLQTAQPWADQLIEAEQAPKREAAAIAAAIKKQQDADAATKVAPPTAATPPIATAAPTAAPDAAPPKP